MTKRVLGHGATCCGCCDLCQPEPVALKPEPVAPKGKPAAKEEDE